jgi:hypothetical protein
LAGCHSADCRAAECHGAKLSITSQTDKNKKIGPKVQKLKKLSDFDVARWHFSIPGKELARFVRTDCFLAKTKTL